MPLLYLVRHGKPLSSYAQDRDPPLHPEGVLQAQAAAQDLASLGPLPLLTSPLMRCRETAAPLGVLWERTPEIVEAVREIPSPGQDAAARADFIAAILNARWSEVLAATPSLRAWHEGLSAALFARESDTVVFSHYIAINVIVGQALESDLISCFRPGHASVTIVEQDRGRFRLVRLGHEAPTALTSG